MATQTYMDITKKSSHVTNIINGKINYTWMCVVNALYYIFAVEELCMCNCVDP